LSPIIYFGHILLILLFEFLCLYRRLLREKGAITLADIKKSEVMTENILDAINTVAEAIAK